jgi:hypothetical protein
MVFNGGSYHVPEWSGLHKYTKISFIKTILLLELCSGLGSFFILDVVFIVLYQQVKMLLTFF